MKRRARSKSFSRITPFSLLGGAFAPFIFLSISLGLIAFSSMNAERLGGLRTATSDLLSPALNFVSRPVQDAAMFVRDVSGLAQLQAENMRLRQENIRLRDWHQAAMFLDAENKSLRSLLKMKLDPSLSYISARVMADSGNAYVKSLLLSIGEDDGVQKGGAVLGSDGLAGRIVEVGNASARVLLVTDINSRIPVLIEGVSQHAVMAGTNENMPVLVHLPPGMEVPVGSRVITSGHGGVFPYGLPVGQVVITRDGEAGVALYADLDRLVHVRIVNRPEDPNLRSFQ